MRKYPRTQHLIGSAKSGDDHDLASVAFGQVRGRFLVVEEKLDGANSGISFDSGGRIRLQSRGHYLAGGPREAQFAPLKAWAGMLRDRLWPVLGTRYVLYGEWMFAVHSIFYDALPHFFCEFDVLDTESDQFLSTARRGELLAGLPISSVPVLTSGGFERMGQLTELVGPSTCRSTTWRESLAVAAEQAGVRPGPGPTWVDASDQMEGLYLKLESADHVLGRFKWVRPGFTQHILGGGKHWLDRPMINNQLSDPAALYAID
jgi:hypothetical protein